MVNSTAGFKWYAHPESDCVLLESCRPGPECDELGDAWMTEHIAGIIEETLKAKFPKPDFQITRYEQLILTTYIELP